MNPIIRNGAARIRPAISTAVRVHPAPVTRSARAMLKVTVDAKRICSATIRQLAGQGAVKCLRLVREEGNTSIFFDVPHSSDEIVRHDGLPILAVPKALARSLAGQTLDVRDDGRFVITA